MVAHDKTDVQFLDVEAAGSGALGSLLERGVANNAKVYSLGMGASAVLEEPSVPTDEQTALRYIAALI
jgi:hypothetical protein